MHFPFSYDPSYFRNYLRRPYLQQYSIISVLLSKLLKQFRTVLKLVLRIMRFFLYEGYPPELLILSLFSIPRITQIRIDCELIGDDQ